MASFYKQHCPLCDAEAEYCWVDFHNRKFFECPNCTRFQISKRAESVLAELSKDRKTNYAARAPQRPDQQMLVIRMSDHKHRMSSDDSLQVAFVPEAELPLDCE